MLDLGLQFCVIGVIGLSVFVSCENSRCRNVENLSRRPVWLYMRLSWKFDMVYIGVIFKNETILIRFIFFKITELGKESKLYMYAFNYFSNLYNTSDFYLALLGVL